MRKPFPEYMMLVARAVATRATCDRKHVGAVIVRNNHIIKTGYNGSLPGQPHCDEVGHMMEDGHCVRTIHAEANAIIQAARYGNATDGATIYTTASPCWPCFQKIVSAGIKKIVFGELYRDARIHDFAKSSGIELVDMSQAPIMTPAMDALTAARQYIQARIDNDEDPDASGLLTLLDEALAVEKRGG